MCKYRIELHSCGHLNLKAGTFCDLTFQQLSRINDPTDTPDGIPFDMPSECDPNMGNIYWDYQILSACTNCCAGKVEVLPTGHSGEAGWMGTGHAVTPSDGIEGRTPAPNNNMGGGPAVELNDGIEGQTPAPNNNMGGGPAVANNVQFGGTGNLGGNSIESRKGKEREVTITDDEIGRRPRYEMARDGTYANS